jgi:hypothetical protein
MENQSSPNQTTSQFEKLLVEIARAGVDFAVVGGIAVVLNGFERNTRDLDIIVHPGAENVRKLIECLTQWGEGFARELSLRDFQTLDEGSLRIMEEFDLDVFVKLNGRSLDDFRSRLRFLRSQEVSIAYLSPEDLIHCKRNSWRDKDQLDVRAMMEIIRNEQQNEK